MGLCEHHRSQGTLFVRIRGFAFVFLAKIFPFPTVVEGCCKWLAAGLHLTSDIFSVVVYVTVICFVTFQAQITYTLHIFIMHDTVDISNILYDVYIKTLSVSKMLDF